MIGCIFFESPHITVKKNMTDEIIQLDASQSMELRKQQIRELIYNNKKSTIDSAVESDDDMLLNHAIVMECIRRDAVNCFKRYCDMFDIYLDYIIENNAHRCLEYVNSLRSDEQEIIE